MSKYVLYDGKAYESYDQDDVYFGIKGVGPIPKSKCTEITEAEYHARKLMELNPQLEVLDAVQVIEQCERERQPKPEVTNRHIDCLVEWRFKDKPDFMLVQLEEDFERDNQEYRLPRRPVPLAFHKHDGGERPEWVSEQDRLVIKTNETPFFRWLCTSEAGLHWENVEAFAVIKPILPE